MSYDYQDIFDSRLVSKRMCAIMAAMKADIPYFLIALEDSPDDFVTGFLNRFVGWRAFPILDHDLPDGLFFKYRKARNEEIKMALLFSEDQEGRQIAMKFFMDRFDYDLGLAHEVRVEMENEAAESNL